MTRVDLQLFLLLGSAWAVPAVTKYQPTRYFVPVLTLAIALVALHAGREVLQRSWRGVLMLVPLSLSIIFGAQASIDHLLHAPATYLDATSRMKDHFDVGAVLMGDTAPQIAIETNVWAISGSLGRGTPADRMREHRPTHFVSRGPLSVPDRELFEANSCAIELLDRYDVFNNPTGRPLHLYRLDHCDWPVAEGPEHSIAGSSSGNP